MPVFALLPTTAKSMCIPETNSNTHVHNISIKNIEKFEAKLSELNSDPMVALLKVNTNISAQEAQLQFDNYYSRLQEIYKECFMETIELNDSKRNFFHKPWITLAIAKSCLTKNKLCRIKVSRRGKSGSWVQIS